MTEPPLPNPDTPESPIPWDALEDLAAGDLPREAVANLRARIEAEPELRAAYAEVERIEALLRAETPYQAPVGLTQRILREVVPPATLVRPRPMVSLGRVAAAIVVFFSSWLIVGGETPALASVSAAPMVTASLPSVETASIVAEAPAVPGEPLAIALVGIALVLVGLGLAVRWHRGVERRAGGAA